MFHYISKILPIKSRNKTFMFTWNKAEKILHPLTCIKFYTKEAFSRQAGILKLTSVLCTFGFDCLTVKPLSKILFFLNLILWNTQNKTSLSASKRLDSSFWKKKNLSSWIFLTYYCPCHEREKLFLLYYSVSFTLAAGQVIVLIPWCSGKLSSMSWENFKNEAFI